MFNTSKHRPSIWPSGIHFYRVEVSNLAGEGIESFYLETLYDIWPHDRSVVLKSQNPHNTYLTITYIKNPSE